MGNTIKDDCQRQIDEVTSKVKDQLRSLHDHLASVWGMSQNLEVLIRHCGQLDQLLIQIAQERSLILKSLSAVSCHYGWFDCHPPSLLLILSLSLSLSLSVFILSCSPLQSTPVSEAHQHRATPTGAGGVVGTPPVVVSPPVGWPQPHPPVSPAGSYYTNPQSGQQGVELDSLRREKADLTTKLNSKHQEVEKLSAELSTLKGQVGIASTTNFTIRLRFTT